MRDTIKFIDVETPNQYHDRVCQVGLVETDLHGNVLREEEALVNPEADFYFMNTKVHGIHKEDVIDKPTFPQVWSEMFGDEPEMNIVAHNATYDLAVLSKTLFHYQIDIPKITYADTKELAKNALPTLSKFRLNHVCGELGIPIEKHHDALCDAMCCNKVYWSVYGGLHDFKEYFPVVYRRSYEDKSSNTLTPFQLLRKTASRVASDGVVTEQEARSIIRLITNNNSLMETNEAVDALELLYLCLEDGYIDPIESDTLVHYLNECL